MGNTPVILPQDDEQVDTRQRALQEARGKYQLKQHTFGLSAVQQRLVNIVNIPPMLSKLPKEEKQSLYYKIRFAAQYLFFALYALFQRLVGCGRQWTIDRMVQHFRFPCLLKEPKGCEVWRKTAINRQEQTEVGFTHILMDGVSVCMHRNLSNRHPIYKILLPHFRYMHAINIAARDDLLPPGGFIEKDMYIKRVLMIKLISKHNENCVYDPIQTSLEKRGAKDIPGYFFKDDALQLEGAIRRFVHQYVTHYYKNDDRIVKEDEEIQGFYQELMAERAMDGSRGCGMNGIPEINSVKNLVDVLTYFIYTCSVEHSATNFPQYEQYAFPPNFAALLHGHPEDEKADIDAIMPTREEMFSTIKIMKVLTLVFTNSLGNYEDVYMREMDTDGRNFVAAFQQHLTEIQNRIDNRNADIMAGNDPNQLQEYQYEWLLPKNVLNSISI
uniref:Lipoxygenase domain-containing protein n=1 Tax=Magallana gigas TaxID=29159 RepID=A0A8W8JAT5_MAGGI